VQEAPALRVSGRIRWVATLFEFGTTAKTFKLHYQAADRWHAEATAWTASRDGDTVVATNRNSRHQLKLRAAPDVSLARKQVTAALRDTTMQYPKYVDLDYYRQRAAKILGFIWVLQLLGRRVLALKWPAAHVWRTLDSLAVVAWSVLGVWLTLRYFVGN
jgi:hypothetical protein